MLEKFTLFVGLADKDTKKQEVSTKEAYEKLSQIIGDCTISQSIGYYTHDNGDKVSEQSLRIEILFKTYDEVKMLCGIIKRELNQESVALERTEIESELL